MKSYVYDHRPDIPQLEKDQQQAYRKQKLREERDARPIDPNPPRVTIQNATREQVVEVLHAVTDLKKLRRKYK